MIGEPGDKATYFTLADGPELASYPNFSHETLKNMRRPGYKARSEQVTKLLKAMWFNLLAIQ